MIRAFEISDSTKYRDFENFVFTYPEKHSITFDYANDKFTADSVDYAISTLLFLTDDNHNIANSENNTDAFANILEKYVIALEDVTSTTEYYGNVDADGNWYILKIDKNNHSYKYANGTSDFLSNWNDRDTLIYKYFNELVWQ